MLYVRIIKHQDLAEELLFSICNIKAIAWPYDLNSQKEWITKNLLNNDCHFLLYDERKLIAYMNLVNIQITINYNKKQGLGIGNVCSLEKGKGYGAELIKAGNKYLHEVNVAGLLFCNKSLIDFYKKYGWNFVPKDKISFSNVSENTFETMLFNIPCPIESILYGDRLF
ncbi:GNAT family N-acetyltransferase [bacterium]|nr:MAG: GNAT family N-acetyltransferase [bacterium]